MALTQSNAHILTHLRSHYLATLDDEQSRRVLHRAQSPPIPVDVLELDSSKLEKLAVVEEEEEEEEHESVKSSSTLKIDNVNKGNVLSKLFRHSWGSKATGDTDMSDTGDDDDDDDMSDGDISNNDDGFEVDEDEDINNEGILVNQNYSGLNTSDSKSLFDSVSSGDDDLLLDSDFSDDTYFSKSRSKSSSKKRRRESMKKESYSRSIPTLSNMSQFEKITPIQQLQVSTLSSLIGKRTNTSLERFSFVNGENISNKQDVMNLKVWLPNDTQIDILIRKSVTVFDTIGYILLKTESNDNPNNWCLKLVDDGEPYEGSFGLLDRLKIIGEFALEEVALCNDDLDANELKTPFANTLNQNSYYKSIIPKVDNQVKDAKKVTIKVYHDNTYQSFDLLISDHINDILQKYTHLNQLDPNDYALKPVKQDIILNLQDDITSLDGNYSLQIITKRSARLLPTRAVADTPINSNLTPTTLVYTEQPKPPKPTTKTSPSKSKDYSFKDQLPLTAQYLKYTVWRRLPMSFINRHERTLAIDGEYVYIMPNEKNWYDTKNKTFHVSQILGCKVSKRIASNFKIVVRKSNGPKRYVFEAVDSVESREIVEKLQTLRDAYKINTESVT